MNAFKNLILGTAVLTVGAVAALPVNVSAAANNGTLKVHEQDTPAATESNDPKVCNFNFEGFGFDKNQSGIIVITTQGGGNDKTKVAQVDMPAANADGYTETDYVSIPNGHYKSTLYGKSTNGSVNYNNDLKAKSKVFKVVCEDTTVTTDDDTTTAGGVGGSTTTGGNVLSDAASTTKDVKGAATLPATIPETGFSPLQALFNTFAAGAGVYTAMLRRK